MIVVTGGAGFIGSNLVHRLNHQGRRDILVVDDLSEGRKFANLADAVICDFLDPAAFRAALAARPDWLSSVETVYHLGACSNTTEWNGRYMLDANFQSSREILDACAALDIPLVYASSAAVYGHHAECREDPACETPLNVYGYSKLLFDQHLRQRLPSLRIPVVGLRYFNVYGPREQHKGRMASVVHHFNQQLLEHGEVRLFEGSHGMGDGEHLRDFVHVDDVVSMTIWAARQRGFQGVLNCGTGQAATFNTVARAILAWHGRGRLSYIPFPADLFTAYQAQTRADMSAAERAGCPVVFRDVATGVKDYLDWLNA
jgi:ADP-L-glycero-D-manno-heptose 6-epimerase